MKNVKTLLAAGVAAASMTMVAAPASAELSASASVASMYLWRGFDLSDGSPAVSGDITYSAGGFYTGIWGSSGDDTYGQEVDYYAGFATEVGPVSVDISVWNYTYTGQGPGWDPDETGVTSDAGDTWGDLSEIIIGLGVGPVSLTIYDNVAGAPGYFYYTLGYDVGSFSFMLGGADSDDEDSNYAHFDVSYAYNDNLSFTFSQMIDEDNDDDLKFVVSYSLPIL
ncbi:TorF family putative porin [Spongiibacter taiwanensis]|uniref:TorF family putative porin n=1 Tax=Spongiibacter taiwanensis TaxID=1748242 RepID=UPI002036605E|nr:TorF family putative porin [Spongiibacter taiwanensis]USA44742.1 TorF family putative porin [Spongiibacter taiwanensis]